MIPPSFVQDLLNRIDIVDVIDPIVRLKRAGANLVACCPFHAEKTPSFTVSPSKQFYHCFGCGAHGSAIGFLMEHSGLAFVESVKELAARIGMVVPDAQDFQESKPSRGRTESLLAVMEGAEQFYRKSLKQSPRAIEYLKRRGMSGEIAAHFGVGYAPDGWNNLAAVFEDYSQETLGAAGLVIDADSGRRYDRFRDRIMFPIKDVQGRTIGFGGRVLDAGEPKYLNSPETPLFEKGREVYGLFQARQAIRGANRVIVVEGYMDVVALAQFGVDNTVATLGTATTPIHVQKLLRQSDEIVFCFDGDQAGRKAAWRALENSLAQIKDGKQIRFLFLPDGEDPDTYVRRHGAQRFRELIDTGALPLSAVAMRELTSGLDLGTPEGKAKFLQDIKPLLAQIGAPMLAMMMRKRAAEVAGLSDLEARRELKSRPPGDIQTAPRRAPNVRSPLRTLVELLCLGPIPASIGGGVTPFDLDGVELLEVSSREIELYRDMASRLREGEPVRHLTEQYRGTELEALAQDVERSALDWERKGLDAAALELEMQGASRALREQVRRARQKRLLDTLNERQWTLEEKEQFRKLQLPA